MSTEHETKTVTEKITLQPIQIGELTVQIKGLTPLLMNKVSDKVKAKLIGDQTGKTKKKELRNPKEEVKQKIHTLPNGKIGFPSAGFIKGMQYVAEFMNLKRKDVTCISPMNEYVEINFKKQTTNESIARIGSFHTPQVTFRPEFHDWSTKLNLRFNASLISPEQILNLLKLAGLQAGLGDWRPNKSGSHGQYTVDKLTIIEGR